MPDAELQVEPLDAYESYNLRRARIPWRRQVEPLDAYESYNTQAANPLRVCL